MLSAGVVVGAAGVVVGATYSLLAFIEPTIEVLPDITLENPQTLQHLMRGEALDPSRFNPTNYVDLHFSPPDISALITSSAVGDASPLQFHGGLVEAIDIFTTFEGSLVSV